jgi:hypothetical protein
MTRIKGATWLDVTNLVMDDWQITKGLVNTDLKKERDTITFRLAYTSELATFLSQDVNPFLLEFEDENNNRIFTGVLRPITSINFGNNPAPIECQGIDYSELLLSTLGSPLYKAEIKILDLADTNNSLIHLLFNGLTPSITLHPDNTSTTGTISVIEEEDVKRLDLLENVLFENLMSYEFDELGRFKLVNLNQSGSPTYTFNNTGNVNNAGASLSTKEQNAENDNLSVWFRDTKIWQNETCSLWGTLTGNSALFLSPRNQNNVQLWEGELDLYSAIREAFLRDGRLKEIRNPKIRIHGETRSTENLQLAWAGSFTYDFGTATPINLLFPGWNTPTATGASRSRYFSITQLERLNTTRAKLKIHWQQNSTNIWDFYIKRIEILGDLLVRGEKQKPTPITGMDGKTKFREIETKYINNPAQAGTLQNFLYENTIKRNTTLSFRSEVERPLWELITFSANSITFNGRIIKREYDPKSKVYTYSVKTTTGITPNTDVEPEVVTWIPPNAGTMDNVSNLVDDEGNFSAPIDLANLPSWNDADRPDGASLTQQGFGVWSETNQRWITKVGTDGVNLFDTAEVATLQGRDSVTSKLLRSLTAGGGTFQKYGSFVRGNIMYVGNTDNTISAYNLTTLTPSSINLTNYQTRVKFFEMPHLGEIYTLTGTGNVMEWFNINSPTTFGQFNLLSVSGNYQKWAGQWDNKIYVFFSGSGGQIAKVTSKSIYTELTPFTTTNVRGGVQFENYFFVFSFHGVMQIKTYNMATETFEDDLPNVPNVILREGIVFENKLTCFGETGDLYTFDFITQTWLTPVTGRPFFDYGMEHKRIGDIWYIAENDTTKRIFRYNLRTRQILSSISPIGTVFFRTLNTNGTKLYAVNTGNIFEYETQEKTLNITDTTVNLNGNTILENGCPVAFCKAYLRYNGSTNVITKSFNIHSVVRNSTGTFTVTLDESVGTDTPIISVNSNSPVATGTTPNAHVFTYVSSENTVSGRRTITLRSHHPLNGADNINPTMINLMVF